MATPTTPEEALQQAAIGGVHSVTVSQNSQTTQGHSLSDLMKVADREKADAAGNLPGLGLRFTKLQPPQGGDG